MNKKVLHLSIALFVISIMLVGCGSKAASTPTTNPNLIYTAAADTAVARLTQIFKSTPSATAGAQASSTSTTNPNLAYTAAVQTVSAQLTQSITLTPSPQVTGTSAPVSTSSGGDRAVYVADVTIPDGSVIAPGAAFVKTWKLQNAGTTTWTTSYSFVYFSGEQMGTANSVSLDQSVAPGQQIDISVDMVAPNATGSYQSYWKMKNTSGQLFNDSVYVLITVGSGAPAPSATTSGGTPVASPTSTGQASNPITNLAMSVDQGTFTGECPHLFAFAATFTLNQGATLTYGVEAFSETPGFSFTLPSPQTSTFSAGTYSLSFPMEFTDSGIGWVRFHVTAPVDAVSNQASFNLTCNP